MMGHFERTWNILRHVERNWTILMNFDQLRTMLRHLEQLWAILSSFVGPAWVIWNNFESWTFFFSFKFGSRRASQNNFWKHDMALSTLDRINNVSITVALRDSLWLTKLADVNPTDLHPKTRSVNTDALHKNDFCTHKSKHTGAFTHWTFYTLTLYFSWSLWWVGVLPSPVSFHHGEFQTFHGGMTGPRLACDFAMAGAQWPKNVNGQL